MLAACGEGSAVTPEATHVPRPAPSDPVGERLLPDLVPAPPEVLHLRFDDPDDYENSNWEMAFTSTLVNVGTGDFVLRGTRTGDDWAIDQEILYSISGGEIVPTQAAAEWGGDGHHHWHVVRVANYWLEPYPLAEEGHQVAAAAGLIDTKVGFCFFDSDHELERGPAERVFEVEGCGHEDDNRWDMGLSPGWSDVYKWTLPGQSIDITGLADGRYRLWAEADHDGVFVEEARDNNLTWVDIELETRPDRIRTATVVEVGPEPD